LLPERIEDYIDDENPVRALDAFVDNAGLRKKWVFRHDA